MTWHGGEPRRELTRVVLDEDADEALDGAEAHAVQHDGALLGAVGVNVLEVEVQRHLEVELDGAALPGAAERVLQVEVDLGAVEGAIALVDRRSPCGAARERSCRPSSARAQSSSEPMESSGRVESSTWYLKPNCLVHGVDEVHDAHDLVGELVGAHEQVGVVLR